MGVAEDYDRFVRRAVAQRFDGGKPLGTCDLNEESPHPKAETCVNWKESPKPWRFIPFGDKE